MERINLVTFGCESSGFRRYGKGRLGAEISDAVSDFHLVCLLWNFIYASAGTGKDARLEDAVRTLVEIPMDTIYWGSRNSRRADLMRFKIGGIPSEQRPHYLLSRRNTAVMKWNGNPYGLDFGGHPRDEDDGAFWLLPYWMGRHHGFIED